MSRIYTLTPIRSDADHKAALKLAQAYIDAPQEPARTARKAPTLRP